MIINCDIEIPILIIGMSEIKRVAATHSTKHLDIIFCLLELKIRKHIGDRVINLVHVSPCIEGYEKLKNGQVMTVRIKYYGAEDQDARLFFKEDEWSWGLGPCSRV
jgi:hypothetical protein